MSLPAHVRIVEVGPRDGLQNEKAIIATADKIALIDRLSATGLRSIEATSFVSPKWVPQLADAAEVFAGIAQARRASAIRCWCRTSRATSARAPSARTEVAVFTAASEAFNRKNINASIDESLERFAPVLERAARRWRARARLRLHRARLPLPGRGAAGRRGARGATRCTTLGCYEVSLGDTIGVGTPAQGARDAARGRRRSADGRARRAFPRHLRPGAGQHPRLPGGRRARGRLPRSPAPAAAPTRRAPAATSPPRTWCTCCTAWASTPASTSTALVDTGRWLAGLLGRDTGSKVDARWAGDA